jgi:3',5'-cyclic AMP phosphodiesterase CpdA
MDEMSLTRAAAPKLVGVSDLHVGFPENRQLVTNLWPESAGDWLLVAGDVSEIVIDIEWALTTLSKRFRTVVWVPGNHELWTHREDPVQLRGERRYRHLVELCRSLGVLTPEDPYQVWEGPGGPVTILVNHFPLIREPTRALRYQQFAQWCGTTATADWHIRFNAAAAVYGDLHIPRTTWHDGVPFEEVSYGYPREWQRRGEPPGPPRQILPGQGG